MSENRRLGIFFDSLYSCVSEWVSEWVSRFLTAQKDISVQLSGREIKHRKISNCEKIKNANITEGKMDFFDEIDINMIFDAVNKTL